MQLFLHLHPAFSIHQVHKTVCLKIKMLKNALSHNCDYYYKPLLEILGLRY